MGGREGNTSDYGQKIGLHEMSWRLQREGENDLGPTVEAGWARACSRAHAAARETWRSTALSTISTSVSVVSDPITALTQLGAASLHA